AGVASPPVALLSCPSMNHFVLFALLLFSMRALAAETSNWPQFRGPAGDGHSASRQLPLTWSEQKNVKWKTAMHGKAWSSPVIWGQQVWLTTATEDGTQLLAVCVDRDSGKIVHDLKLFEITQPQFCHKFNSYASPTPVIEESRVYVTFGSPGTACLDTKTGQVLWQRRDLECNHFRGAGSSPILHGNLLIMNFDGSDHQFVVALDKQTGQTIWRTNRGIDFKDLGADGKPELEGDYRKAFSTPHVANIGGQPILISQGAKAIYGYEPLTGMELWRVEERTSHSASSRPIAGHGLVFAPSGWSTGQLLAIHPGQDCEVVDANSAPADSSNQKLKIVWQTKRGVPRKPSLLLIDDLLVANDDGGIVTCFEAKTGKEVWKERVPGNYSAAPLHADGRIYFFSEEGKTTVIEAGREFKKLSENALADGFMASPAASGRALFLRTRTHLYRVEE
ncbi:MAG: PQQ-binding-like beta-propeller repeat protein, partial [Verrucomicrobiales bacterium]|nr:PQQ-binding-like beta-propeller repeat protein [Verrucomicrobiales bacterium]